VIKHSKYNSQSGFTLIELLVVTSIMALIASITLVGFVNARKQARDVVRSNHIREVVRALALYKADKGYYPSCHYINGVVEVASLVSIYPEWKLCLGKELEAYLPLMPQDPSNDGAFLYSYVDAEAAPFDGTQDAASVYYITELGKPPGDANFSIPWGYGYLVLYNLQ
jgi:prepilin-type N-terminal cleavage/methylation domain-containing protein